MKISKFIIRYTLLLVLLLAFFLRVWRLGVNPPHLTPDEASLGYNAYSILKTARDEYGNFMPVIFKSFGDFKPGLYIYLAAPSVAIFGLNEFAVRFPSALAGTVAVWLLYMIVVELFKEKKSTISHQSLAIIASFMLAISPWHIHFSRGAWEVNVSLTLTLAGIYFFLKALDKEKYIIYSALFFGVTLITYQGAKLATAVILAILIILYWKKLVSLDKKTLVSAVAVGIIVSLPIILSLFQGKAGRLEVFSVFSYPRQTEYLEDFLSQGEENVGDLSYYLFHPESLNFTRGILGRWFNHFSARFLFFEGDWRNPRHSAPYHGEMFLFDSILLITGFIALVRKKSKFTYIVFLWLVFAPLPAALSRDEVHAVRAFNMVIPLVLISSSGAELFVRSMKKLSSLGKYLSSFFLIIIFFGSFIYYLDSYFVHLPVHDSKYWEYGYKQIVETVTPIQDKYQTVKVRQSFAQPYIYFLFYQKYNPVDYQKQAKLTESEYGDVGYVEHLDNIYFAPIDWSINRGESGTLFVADPIRIPPEDSSDENLFKLIKEIKYLDGTTAFRILEVK